MGQQPMTDSQRAMIQIARLGREGGDAEGMQALAEAFAARNPGYVIESAAALSSMEPREGARAVFITRGEAQAEVSGPEAGERSSELSVGDLVWLRGGESLSLDRPCDVVVFTVPSELPAPLPTFIRPDHDPKITDTPGGCAEEERAYRRILVTWLVENGPYTFEGLNAHRVRMWNSFSHYHPPSGGFDELYIVQDVEESGRIHISPAREQIESAETVSVEDAAGLIQTFTPEVGDLMYIPRGVIHRAVGGVLAQVVTVPGFKPGFEVGVDHHLRAINERLGLEGEDALPLQQSSSVGPVIK